MAIVLCGFLEIRYYSATMLPLNKPALGDSKERAIFLDLKKAFDTVDQKILIDQLMKYGFKGIEWYNSYLSGRKQFCIVNGQASSIDKAIFGTPQGSCLGPILFII